MKCPKSPVLNVGGMKEPGWGWFCGAGTICTGRWKLSKGGGIRFGRGVWKFGWGWGKFCCIGKFCCGGKFWC